jgi:hypothetical protein
MVVFIIDMLTDLRYVCHKNHQANRKSLEEYKTVRAATPFYL